jgi:hyperosmotically inducible periplasmic protein
MRSMRMVTVVATGILMVGLGCNRASNASYKDGVKRALEQVDLKDVTVTEDAAKNTITLGGVLHSENSKQQATEVAQSAAGNRIVVNEISVQPVGQESQARSIASNVDDAIEKNYKAALIAKGLDKERIRYDAKNGVLTLKGSVKSAEQRQMAQEVASNVPNVQQVLNELQVRR